MAPALPAHEKAPGEDSRGLVVFSQEPGLIRTMGSSVSSDDG